MPTTSKSNQMLKLALKSWDATIFNQPAKRKESIKTAAQNQVKSNALTKQASDVILRDAFLEVFGERNFLVHLDGVEVPLLVTIYEFMENLQNFVCVDESGLWNFIPLKKVLYMTEYVA